MSKQKRMWALFCLVSVMAIVGFGATLPSFNSVQILNATGVSGNITIIADISNADIALFQATSVDGLSRRYFPSSFLIAGIYSNSQWNPYFTGEYKVEITAVNTNDGSKSTYVTNVVISREISGTVNYVRFQDGSYNPTGLWNNIDTNQVVLHDIGLLGAESEVGIYSLGCNLLNANVTITPEMTDEDIDIAFTDTANYKPAGTPFRFSVNLHQRPAGIMGMGDLKRYVWIPANSNNPAGAGELIVDVASCSPWRHNYLTNLNAHVGFAPLFEVPEDSSKPLLTAVAEEDVDLMPIMWTSAHYMDVYPTNDEANVRIGLVVNGHTGTVSYLRAFINEATLRELGVTNMAIASNLLSGYVTHFNELGQIVDSGRVEANFVIISGQDPNEPYFDQDGNGNADAGVLVSFNFTFHSPVAAEVGPIQSDEDIVFAAADFDGDRKADPVLYSTQKGWFVWLSSSGYQQHIDSALEAIELATPVPGDFDGDGKSDAALYVGGSGWFAWLSSQGYQNKLGPFYNDSISGMAPVVADFDGDGLADLGYATTNNGWKVRLSTSHYGTLLGPYLGATPQGWPLAADFDGDRRADPIVYNSNDGWYLWLSTSGYNRTGPFHVVFPTATPVAADFDGDGRIDAGLYIPHTGDLYVWYAVTGYIAPIKVGTFLIR